MPELKCKGCGKKLIDFRTTRDWPNRKYHHTCWDKYRFRLMFEHEDTNTDRDAEIFLKVENAKQRILKRDMPNCYQYISHEIRTPLWKAPPLL
eukprot:SAG22_NODE_45_length_24718_cov_12.462448_9_plen_93_part_00